MPKRLGKIPTGKPTEGELTEDTFVATEYSSSMLEDSVLLRRTRKELSRLKRIGDKEAYQAALEVVAPLLREQDNARALRKKREQRP